VTLPPEHPEPVRTCAGCGAQTATPGTWVRLVDTLLCPDCHSAITRNCAETESSLGSAEREWVRLLRQVYDALARAA